MGLTQAEKVKKLAQEVEKLNAKNANLGNEIFKRDITIDNVESWVDMIRAVCGGLGSIIIVISLFFDFIARKLLLQHNPGISMFQVLGVALGACVWCIAIYRHRE